jgi:hypothetical protein
MPQGGLQEDDHAPHVQSLSLLLHTTSKLQPYHDIDDLVKPTRDLAGNRSEAQHLQDQHDTVPNAVGGKTSLILPPIDLAEPGLRILGSD